MLLRCRNWAGAPATRNLCVLVLAELLAVLPGVPLWSVAKWDFESQTLSAPHFSTRLRNILLFDGISSKLAFSFQTREITQASKLVVSWQRVTQFLEEGNESLCIEIQCSMSDGLKWPWPRTTVYKWRSQEETHFKEKEGLEQCPRQSPY